MPENSNQKEGIESRNDAGEPEIKNEGIESRSNTREPETKLRDRIRARCLRTRKKNEGIEFRCNAGEPEMKRRDRIQARCLRTRNKRNRSNLGAKQENLKQNEGNESEHDA